MGGCYSKGRARGGTSVGYQVRFNPNDDKVELLKDGSVSVSSSLGREASEEEAIPVINNHHPGSATQLLIDPSKCTASGSGTRTAEVDTVTVFQVHIFNVDGDACTYPCSIRGEAVSLVYDSTVRCTVSPTEEPGVYNVTYTPCVRGRHRLRVFVNYAELQKSPFTVVVNPRPDSLGKPVRIIQGLGLPHAITITRDSKIIISEWEANQITTFSMDGTKIQQFGETGRMEGQFIYPWGIATDEEGSIYVADSFNNRIQKFTSEGRFVKAVGSLGSNLGQFNIPSAIRQSQDNMFYVCDTNNRRVQILSSELEVVSCFGSKGIAPGQFWTPQSIAFDRRGNVYVADNKNNTVQAFTSKGEFLVQFGGRGSKPGRLNGPVGVYVDSRDLVYVTEWENSRVSIFDTSGSFLACFGSKGTKPGEFSRPSGIAVDDDGFVYVCDYDSQNGRVQIF